jgi:hypothetical protein
VNSQYYSVDARFSFRGHRIAGFIAAVIILQVVSIGCASAPKGPVAIFLDGAGWYAGSGSVRAGLRKGGFDGRFEVFDWSAHLGPAHDHFVSAHSRLNVARLTSRIKKLRQADPQRVIHLMSLSAGSAVVLAAVEALPEGVDVDTITLLSPTVSAERDLRPVMKHVRRRLYATHSPHDVIASTLAINADGGPGPPAGRRGFKAPKQGDEQTRQAYFRVVNLAWQPSYVGFGWNGSHTSVTDSEFVAGVIAPRLLSEEPFPLDRPMAERLAAGGGP